MVDKGERSPLWSLSALAALGTGAGVGIYKNRSLIGAAIKSPMRDVSAEISSTAAGVGRFAQQRVVNSSFTDIDSVLAGMLNNYAGSSSVKALRQDVRGAALESIMSVGQHTRSDVVRSLSILNEMNTGPDIYRAAAERVSSAGGDMSTFYKRVTGLGNGIAYNASRLDMTQHSIVSPGGFRAMSPRGLFVDQLPHEAQVMAGHVKSTLELALTGKNLTLGAPKFSMIGNTPMMMGDISGVHFSLPLAATGRTYSGRTLSAGYATKLAYDSSGTVIKYPEFALQKLTKAISGAAGTEDLKANFRYLREELMGNADALSAATWLPPKEFATPGQLAMARLRNLEAVQAEEVGQDIIEKQLLGKGFFPFVGPEQAGKGTLTTQHLGEKLFGPLGKWVSAEQRPGQFIREWSLTEASKAELAERKFSGTFGQYWDRLDRKVKGQGWENIVGSHAGAQNITVYSKGALEEEGFLATSIANNIEYERTIQKKIALDEGLTIHEALQALKHPDAKRVEFANPITGHIGRETVSGRELILGGRDLETGYMEMVGAQLSGENEATVFLRERRRLGSDAPWKHMSEENKFMLWQANEQKMREELRRLGLGGGKIAGQNVESIISAKLVERNKMALYNQQVEAMSMILGHKIDTGKIAMNREAEIFLRDPIHAMRVKGIMKRDGLQAEEALQKALVGKAKGWGFSGQELGLTFGLMGRDSLKGLVASGNLTLREAAHIARSKNVIGVGKGRLADLAVGYGTGANKRGSLENTGFRLLAMKGEEGQALAAEFATRIEGKGQLNAADKMFASISGETNFFKDLFSSEAKAAPLSELTEQNIFRNEGYLTDLGKKFGKLYVPGTGEADFLANKVVGNQTIRSPVLTELFGLQRAMASGGSETELANAMMRLKTEVARNVGQQGEATGKIIGSKIMTITRGGPGEFMGINPTSAKEMYEDLIERATTNDQKEFLRQQLKELNAGREGLMSVWRHPTIGLESLQYAKVKLNRDLAPGMLQVPERKVGIKFAGERAERLYDASATIGWSADFDRDQNVIAAIGERDTIDRIKKRMASGEIDKEYMQHVFNYHSMKRAVKNQIKGASENITGLTDEKKLIAGLRRLGLAKTQTGQINIALQKLKMGIQYSAPEYYQPYAGLFEQLEQTAISGKHGVLGDNAAALYQDLVTAVDTKGEEGAKKLSGVLRTAFGDLGTTGVMGGKEYTFKPNFDEISRVSLNAAKTIEHEANTIIRATAFAKGKSVGEGEGLLRMMQEMVNLRKSGSPDVAMSIMEKLGTNKSGVFSDASRVIRRAGAKTSRILGTLKAAKGPLMIGAAAAAGIMLMAPSTAGVIRPAEGANAGRNLNNETLDVPSGMRVGPPPPGPNVSPKVYDSGGVRRTNRANINIQMRDLEGSRKDFMRSASQLSNSGRVNIRTRDDRSSLDPRRLADKITERL